MERSFLENMPRPLFTQLRGETVWKFGIDPESGLRSGQEGSKKSRSAASWRQRRVLETPSAIFQTVSPRTRVNKPRRAEVARVPVHGFGSRSPRRSGGQLLRGPARSGAPSPRRSGGRDAE